MAKAIITAVSLLLLAACSSSSGHLYDPRPGNAGCPFGTTEWLDDDGLKCVPNYQMEQAIYRR